MSERIDSPHDRLQSRLEFEELISDTSAALFAAAPDQVEPSVQQALEHVRDFFQVDRCAVLTVSADRKRVHVRLGAYAEGVPPVAGDLDLAHAFPWSYQKLLVELAPVCVARIDDLPVDARVERESWTQLPIRSALSLPIRTDGTVDHIVVLNTVHHEREWPEVFVNRLRVLAELLVGALQRQAMTADLREAETRVRLAVESAGAGLWSLDYRTGRFWTSPRARAIFGYALDEEVDLERLSRSVHPEDWSAVQAIIARAEHEDTTVSAEYRVQLPGGDGVRWVASHGRRQGGTDGRPRCLTGVSIDISERMRTREALRSSEARLAAGVDLAGLAYYEVDFAGEVTWLDDRFRELCGVPPGRESGLGPLEFWMEQLHPDDRPRVLEDRTRLHDGRLDRLDLEYRFLHPADGLKWIRHVGRVAARDAQGRTTRSFGVLRDITPRMQSEAALRDLSQRLIRAHEQERALLARELHDDVTQRLAALAIDVGRILGAPSDGIRAGALQPVADGLARLSEDIHDLSYQLHPSVLTELGLGPALRAECERRVRFGGFAVELELDPLPPGLDPDTGLCLFRVTQEALGNVARHADARTATVRLQWRDRGLRLTIVDDGVGFDPSAREVIMSLGLQSMRERLELVNGRLEIASAPGGGTTVAAWVPLLPEAP